MTNLLKVHPNERVDIGDFAFLSTSAAEDNRRLARSVFADTDDVIVEGFDFVVLSATQLQINRGRAIVPADATGERGQLLTEGVVSQTLSFSGLAAATYTVWVRFTRGDGALANRVFWDPSATAEVVAAVNTREVPGWSAVVAVAQPGADWVPIWTVAWVSSLLADTITDARKRLFAVDGDGDFVNGSYQIDPTDYRSLWGVGTDRSFDRSTFGIKDLRTFVQAVYKKLEEIQTGTNPNYTAENWWQVPAVGSLDDKLSLAGATSFNAMRGDIHWNLDSNYDIGQAGVRPANIYVDDVDVSERLVIGGGGAPGLDLLPGTVSSIQGTTNHLGSDTYNGTMDFQGGTFLGSGGAMSFSSGSFTYTAATPARVDNMEPDTVAGSFVGAPGNAYEQINAANAFIASQVTSTVMNVSGAALTAVGSAINWNNATATGDLDNLVAGTSDVGGIGKEFRAVRSFLGSFGDPSYAGVVGAVAIINVHASPTAVTNYGINFDFDPATSAGSVFNFEGFTAGVEVLTDPWTAKSLVPNASLHVGAIRIDKMPGVNVGNPVWIHVYDKPTS